MKKSHNIPSRLWRKAIRGVRYSWQQHALVRIAERNITQQVVLDVIAACDILEEYPDDTPFPSALFMGEDSEGRPLHVVASIEIEREWVFIITVYDPDLHHFQEGFRKRRNK